MVKTSRSAGIAAMLGSSASNQAGAAMGALAFPVMGPVGVVAVRQLVSALVLAALARPRFRSMARRDLALVCGLALTFSTMNLGLYSAVERIGLGLAVTLEFLGPLAIAVASSRRAVDAVCAAAAGAGVFVLTNPGPASDVVGIGLALLGAASWAAYILLNRELGRSLPGLRGTSAASLVSAVVWAPIAAVWLWANPPTPAAVVLALACGVLSSAVPYAADLLALRRVPAGLFGTVMSVNPLWAGLAGWVILGQALTLRECAGMALIAAANVVVSWPRRDGGRGRRREAGAPSSASRAASGADA